MTPIDPGPKRGHGLSSPLGSKTGVFVSIDGPRGVGKTTIARHVAQHLLECGERVYVAEEGSSPISMLAQSLEWTIARKALACLYAADRHHIHETDIRPQLVSGTAVVADQYLSSWLTSCATESVDLSALWRLGVEDNAPDLAVFLHTHPDVIAQRLASRHRFPRLRMRKFDPESEALFFNGALDQFRGAGIPTLCVDCTQPAPFAAAQIVKRLMGMRESDPT